MAGAIYKLEDQAEQPSREDGTQAGYDAAVAVLAASPGALQLGPGTEAIVFGAGLDKVALTRVWTQFGVTYMALTSLRIADQLDPTKMIFFDPSEIATGVTRTFIAPNYSGRLIIPAGEGSSGQFLKSLGAGVQPEWATVTIQNNLLDGANHLDTQAAAVTRGGLIIGNGLSKWARLVLGPANTALLSDGTDANWGNVNLLSAFHADTLAGAVQAGDLLFGNATPKWARLPKGVDGEVLQLVAGLPAWGSTPAPSHDTLAHVTPLYVAACTWNNGSNQIDTTTPNGFADVKVGDFIYAGTNATTGNVYRRVQSISSTTRVIADANNTGATLTSVPLSFVPGEHWNDTAIVDGALTGLGFMLTAGRGDYHSGGGTTFQELRGPLRWMGYAAGSIRTDFRVEGSNQTSSGNPNGFALMRQSSANRAYMHTNDLTGIKTLRIGDPDANGQFVFQNPNGSGIGLDIMFDPAGLSARRTFGAPNLSGKMTIRNAEGNHTGQTAAIGSTTLATAPPAGMYRISGYMRCSAAGAAGPNVMQLDWNDGTARSGQQVCTLDLSGTNYGQGSVVIYVASGNVSYNVTYPGGSGTYDARIRMEAI